MSTWASPLLGDVATFVRGINFKPPDIVDLGTSDSVACMRTKNVQEKLDLSDVWAVPKKFVKRNDQILHHGDVLVSSANSWNLVGKCCWIPELPWSASFGGFVSVLRANSEKVEPRYLYRWFSSDRVQNIVRSFGRQTTNISNLDINRCLEMTFPLPPIAQQKRIAAILDQAEELRSLRRQALGELDAIAQSIFLEMFGDPLTNPKHMVSTIRPFAEASSGKSSKKVLSSEPTEIPIYGGNGINGWAVQPLYFEPVLVFGRVGQQCGKTYVTDRPVWVTDNAIAVKIINKQKLHLTYLLYVFSMTHISETVKHLDLPFINQQMILDFSIPIAPLSLQQEFARRVEAIEQLKATHRESLAHLNALFASLQHRAFRGEL